MIGLDNEILSGIPFVVFEGGKVEVVQGAIHGCARVGCTNRVH